MEAIIEYVGGVQFDVVARGHRIHCDQPLENAGADTGMSPPEFLLASLGTCAGYYAAAYLRTRGLPADGLRVRVEAQKEKAPARLASFRIEVTAPGLDAQHEAGVLRAVKACLIHNTLLHAPAIETVVHTGEPVTIDSR